MPQGRVRTAKTPRIASWDILSRPCGTGPWGQILPRTHVLGYSQPSLRDWVCRWSSHADSRARRIFGRFTAGLSRFAEKIANLEAIIPQRLKPDLFADTYVRAEARTFKKWSFSADP
jgi:hypothetical protein